MKTRFNSLDIVCAVTELQRFIGMRVNNVYDIDNKTYLIRLQRSEEKVVLLIESGNRIHLTNFEWPKNIAPSGFSMKLRKHLKNKRLEKLIQMGSDRIIDLQFGTGEAAYHVILELYDRGNIVLTDYEMTILNILRPHTEGDKVKFAVREKYPENRARIGGAPSKEDLLNILNNAKIGDPLKKVLVPQFEFGPALLEHVLIKHGFTSGQKIGKTFDIESSIDKLFEAIEEAQNIMEVARKDCFKGYIVQKKEERPCADPEAPKEYFFSNQEFHPLLFAQHASAPYKEFETFNLAVDEFYSTMEGQKIESRALQQERDAFKKLENIRKDHDLRLNALEKTQESDKHKAELITRNQQLVDSAILAIQSALATQVSWTDIGNLVKEATLKGDPVASSIKQLKLETNHISLYLTDPYKSTDSDSSSQEEDDEDSDLSPATVDIDLALSAFANARKYYDQKRNAAKKQQKTIESQGKAYKSAEKKTKQALKEVQAITNINKARKVYWFEKFFWFISSENYLVIAGRDQQQNELIVKRYMKPKDVYVHADIHGASSIVIKNPTGQDVPPKTLNEAGTMAICYSVAWDAKIVSNAYWVWGEQVTKSAPTGEYLTTGSFMVRGKKNFLPPSHLILGLSFLFRLEDSCVEKHLGERKLVGNELDSISEVSEIDAKDEEIDIEESGDEEKIDEESEHDEGATKQDEQGEGKEEINENTDEDSSNEEENSKFPDTHIKIQHSEGNKVHILTEGILEESEKPQLTRARPHKNQSQKTNRNQQQNLSKEENLKQAQVKRGQKNKLKKIKEKYKHQDDEERQMRMDILQSAGTKKEPKKNKKGKDVHGNKGSKRDKVIPREPKIFTEKENAQEDDEEETTVQVEVDMLDSLTGQPLPEDELLFAIPVVAPYNTLSTYKFKVKITPGTNRRGKAARTAVNMFLKDRTTTQREKDLLKAVRDEQLARNFPGKVKLSAPRLQVLKK